MEMNENGVILEGFRMTELGPLPEEWEVRPLENEWIEFKNGLWKGKKEPYVKVQVLRNTNFNNDGTLCFKDVAELDVEQRHFKDREIAKDDIILERSGGGPTQPVGRVVFFEKEDQFKYSFSNFTTRIRVIDKKRIFPKYLFCFLLDFYLTGKTNDIQNRTTGIRNLDFSKYKQTLIPLPPLLEQQKIAAILSAVQEAKEKTEAVINATRDLKKSMMNYLFTYGPVPVADAENVPLKETEIGMIPEEWEVVRLGDVAGTYSGGTPSRNQKEYFEGEIGWLKSGELNDNYIYSTKEYITEEALKNSSAKYVENNTLLIAMYGATSGKVGLAKTKFTINQAICAINPNSKFCPEFYFFYFQTIRDKLLSMRFGGAQPNLNQQIIKNLKIPLPPLPTQQKIASMLSAIDAKIEAEENKKKALEDLFKTLLHNLMTARIRVNNLEVEI
ncbi:MAG: restriction endonuclease subunit S [Atribacterota bacterium]|nr:restriction endonuclease subunit S [Atribacterota bacterium]